MVPTLTELKRDLDKYESKFVRLVKELPKNKMVVFVDKKEEARAVLMNEETYEKIESYIETADILLSNPNILKELKKSHKEARKSKTITLDDLRQKLGV